MRYLGDSQRCLRLTNVVIHSAKYFMSALIQKTAPDRAFYRRLQPYANARIDGIDGTMSATSSME